jgi:vacuolar-type H+-ATPase subunit I/STV1
MSVAVQVQAMNELANSMDEIIELLKEETALVRAGRLADAGRLEGVKTELAQKYYSGAARIRSALAEIKQSAPTALGLLEQKHKEFRSLLEMNLTVLATAHAVSESIMRGVSDELARKSAPSTYGASGRANVPVRQAAQPLAVSRVL